MFGYERTNLGVRLRTLGRELFNYIVHFVHFHYSLASAGQREMASDCILATELIIIMKVNNLYFYYLFCWNVFQDIMINVSIKIINMNCTQIYINNVSVVIIISIIFVIYYIQTHDYDCMNCIQ